MPDIGPPPSSGGGAPSGSAGGDLGGTYPNPTVSDPKVDVYPCHPALALNTTIDVVAPDTALKPVLCPIVIPGVHRLSTASFRFYLGTATASVVAGFAIYSVTFSGAQTLSATKVADLGGSTTIDCSTGANGPKSGTWASGPIALDFTANTYFLASMASATTITYGANSRTNWFGPMRFGSAVTDATPTSFPSSFTQTSVAAVIQGTTIPAVALVTTNGGNYFF